MKTRKILALCLGALLLVGSIVGCTKDTGVNDAKNSKVEESSKQVKEKPEKKTDEYKIAWYASAPHPFFEEVQKGVVAFEEEYGIEVIKQIGPDWAQNSQNQNIEALAAKGVKYFSVYPSDASGANGLYEELTDRGMKVINFGSSTLLPTTASFAVSTDVEVAAMEATEHLIQMMGGKGKIINVLEILEDANTVLRKRGIEKVVAKYPDVRIVQEISGMKSVEEAVEKIENAISANIKDVDGIIATGFTTSVGIAQTLEDFYSKNDDKKIYAIGIDTDPIVLKAIEDGVMDATVSQNPAGQGYLSCLLLKCLAEGSIEKDGVYQVDSGTVIVTKDNLETFANEIESKTAEIKESLETKYLSK